MGLEFIVIMVAVIVFALGLAAGMIKLICWARVEMAKADKAIAEIKLEKEAAQRMARGE